MFFNQGIRIITGLSLLLLVGCSSGGSTTTTATDNTPINASPNTASVTRNATYNFEATYDVVYGQGLSHSSWNAPSPITQDLLLDIYVPMNDQTERPAMVFIHGGGFVGGDKGTSAPVEFARYFAERGFVSLSINYRLLGDYGTVPQGFVDAADDIPLLTNDERDQIKAMYPATRDAKAAIRWLSANAESYGVDANQISVIGGSAGSFISIALGASNLDDYKDELSLAEDATLASTNLDNDVIVASVVNHWGGPATVDMLALVDDQTRWDPTDAPLSIVHGTEDPTVSYALAEDLENIYTITGAYYEFTTLEGAGHGAWNTTVNGQSLQALGFDFITRVLELDVQEN
ncbi:MAG: carboxylesterase family protein [Pseudomonadota bacterium]